MQPYEILASIQIFNYSVLICLHMNFNWLFAFSILVLLNLNTKQALRARLIESDHSGGSLVSFIMKIFPIRQVEIIKVATPNKTMMIIFTKSGAMRVNTRITQFQQSLPRMPSLCATTFSPHRCNRSRLLAFS